MATISTPAPTTTPNPDPIAHIDPPVQLEEELHLIIHTASKGLLPITKHRDPQGQFQDPIETIDRLTTDITQCLPEVDKCVRQCGHVILFDNEQHMEASVRAATNELENLFGDRRYRMTILTRFVCGDKAETRWPKLYSMLQYLYHDLGHDYWYVFVCNRLRLTFATAEHHGILIKVETHTSRLAKYLHEKIDARWGLFDPELRKLISDRYLHRKNMWSKCRDEITGWLGLLGRSSTCCVTAPLAFASQLGDDPPQFTNRTYSAVDLDAAAMNAEQRKDSAMQSPWRDVIEGQFDNMEEAKRALASDQQPSDNLESAVPESASSGSSSKTKEAAPGLG